jgi:DNA polymerase-1
VNYTENVKGISIYKDDYYYTPSELKKKDGNMYEMKISIEKATNFEMEEGGFITYITNQQRQISKRLNFGLMYSEPISRFQEHLQIDYDTLKPYIDKWWQIYPKITEYIRTIRTQTNIHGYTKTFKGRRMFFPELLENSDIITLNAEKRDLLLTFVNSGTAVDLLKRSIILITESINEAGYDAHIVHTLHDEIIIEVIEKDIDNVKRIVEDIMTRRAFPEFLEKGINIGVDIDVCLWWDKCKETETSSDFIIDEDDCPNFID